MTVVDGSQVYATLKESGLRHWLFSADDPDLDEGAGLAFYAYRHIAPEHVAPGHADNTNNKSPTDAAVHQVVAAAEDEDDEDDEDDDDDDDEEEED